MSAAKQFPDEQELIEKCKGGDPQAFEQLVDKYQNQVYTLAYRFLGNQEDAMDLAQEVFITCYRKIAGFRGQARFSTWLYRLVVNHAKNFLKATRRQIGSRSVSIDETIDTAEGHIPRQIPDPSPNPAEIASSQELQQVVKAKLQRLPLEYRQPLLLRYTEQLSYQEIAKIIGAPVGTIKSRINRGRELLRQLLKSYL